MVKMNISIVMECQELVEPIETLIELYTLENERFETQDEATKKQDVSSPIDRLNETLNHYLTCIRDDLEDELDVADECYDALVEIMLMIIAVVPGANEIKVRPDSKCDIVVYLEEVE